MNNSYDDPACAAGAVPQRCVVTDSFSWRRVAMIARFYYPVLRKQIIAMPIGVFVCVLVMSYTMSVYESDLALIVSTMPIALMMMLAPIGLARRDCRPLSDQLPATALEKLVFLILYFNIVVMLLTSGVSLLSALVLMPIYSQSMSWLTDIYVTFEDMFKMSPWNPVIWPSSCMFQYCTLYGVISAKKNRMLKGFAWLFVSFVLYQLICSIVGLSFGIYVGIHEGLTGEEEIGLSIMTLMPVFFRVLMTVMTICTIVLACMVYKKLRYHGF